MPERSITAVCLDAGGTLLHCDPPPAEIYADHLSRFGRPVSVEEVDVAFRAAWDDMRRRTPTGIDRYGSHDGGELAWWGAFVRTVIARLDHDAPWRPLLDELYAAFADPAVWLLFPETMPVLRALRGRGIALALVSNWDRRLLRILDDLELSPLLDAVTISSLEGVEKPNPEIFRRALAGLGVDADAAIHVGDSPWEDYRGAADAGLTPILVDRSGAHAGEAYRTIATLEALLDIVA